MARTLIKGEIRVKVAVTTSGNLVSLNCDARFGGSGAALLARLLLSLSRGIGGSLSIFKNSSLKVSQRLVPLIKLRLMRK